MSGLVKIYNYVLYGMAIGSGISISVATILIIIDVLMRITGFEPWIFVLTTVEYILLYFTMLAAPFLLRIKGHVFIDAVTQFFPPTIKKVVAKIVYTACIVACTIYCFQLVNLLIESIQSGEIDMRSMEIPIWILFAPMPLCFFMLCFEFLRYLIGIDDMYSQDLIERENV